MEENADIEEFLSGRKLTDCDAQEFENTLAVDPSDVRLRRLVLSYYAWNRRTDGEKRGRKHALWLIAHCPRDSFGNQPHLFMALSPSDYPEARVLWLKHLAIEDNDIVLIRNAARNLSLLGDKLTAEQLWKEAKRLEPLSSEWPEELSRLYSFWSREQDGASHRFATMALEEQEQADLLNLLASGETIAGDEVTPYSLWKMPRLAFLADQKEKSLKYAEAGLTRILNSNGSPESYLERLFSDQLVSINELARKHLVDQAVSIDKQLAYLLLSELDTVCWWGGRNKLCSSFELHIGLLHKAAKLTSADNAAGREILQPLVAFGCSLAKFQLAIIYEGLGGENLHTARLLHEAAANDGVLAAVDRFKKLCPAGAEESAEGNPFSVREGVTA